MLLFPLGVLSVKYLCELLPAGKRLRCGKKMQKTHDFLTTNNCLPADFKKPEDVSSCSSKNNLKDKLECIAARCDTAQPQILGHTQPIDRDSDRDINYPDQQIIV